jgi:hypothetical protein
MHQMTRVVRLDTHSHYHVTNSACYKLGSTPISGWLRGRGAGKRRG